MGFPMEGASLHHHDQRRPEFEVRIPLMTLGPMATLAVEEAENSLMVLLAMARWVVANFEGIQDRLLTRFIEEGRHVIEPFSRLP